MRGAREFLAAKLAAGAPGTPPKAAWWPAHLRDIQSCLEALDGPRERIAAARSKAVSRALEWDLLIPASASKRLMERHVEFEVDLIEAAKAGDPTGIDRIGGLLLANATAQAHGFASIVPSFPEERFLRIFEAHLALVAETVIEKFGAAKPNKPACRERAEANALALAAFSVEWF